jgi:short-subunit dehydrogenase
MAYALITGASKGIGKEIAMELADRGYELLLVARNSYELQQVKEDIQKKYRDLAFPVFGSVTDQIEEMVFSLDQQSNIDVLAKLLSVSAITERVST